MNCLVCFLFYIFNIFKYDYSLFCVCRNLYSISSRDDDGVYVKPTDVDIDLNLSAYANSRK